MPTIICYLIKKDFNSAPRYGIADGGIVENKQSMFDSDVTLDNPHVIDHIKRVKKVQPKVIYPADSPNTVYYRNQEAKPPDWVSFWEVANPITVQTADAIAVLEAGNRMFAICHGHSSHLLNPYSVEYDFGLKTALNLVDKGSIRSTDFLTPSELAIRTRKQASVDADFDDYDVNVLTTILKNITGKVRKKYANLFESINGAESIKFVHRGTAGDLAAILTDLLGHYASDEYQKQGFEFIDNFMPVKDPAQLDTFDSLLMKAINDRNPDLVLCIPAALDYDGILNFRFKSLGQNRKKVFDHLEIETTLFAVLKETGKKFEEFEDFRSVRLEVVDQENHDLVIRHYPIRNCIYWEMKYAGKTYFFESGTWYLVNDDYLLLIDSSVNGLINASQTLAFPYKKEILRKKYYKNTKRKAYENWYNIDLVEHFKANKKEAELLDTKEVRLKGQTAIEVCDILLKEGTQAFELFHIKYKYGSSALSHLFSQGNVSAEMLTQKAFRTAANHQITIASLKFPANIGYDPKNYTIVYGIISKPSNNGALSIPLFSRINLKVFVDNLSRMQYKVRLCNIKEE